MDRLTDNKIVLVTRPTRLAELVIRFNTVSQARFYIEHQGADFSDYLREDEQYHRALSETQAALSLMGRVQIVDRGFLPNFLFAAEDTVVILGQDGLVANTLKYLDGQPVVGVNPDPERWDGRLLPFRPGDLTNIMPEVMLHRCKTRSVTMAKAALNNGQVLYAVNDLFIGPRTHTSARYEIRSGDLHEMQSSSGVIVSTGLGSTGWLKSLLTGASAITSSINSRSRRKEALMNALGARVYDPQQLRLHPSRTESQQPPTPNTSPSITRSSRREEALTSSGLYESTAAGFSWSSDYLYFTVREPFPTRTTGASLVFGRVTPELPLILDSRMPENGVIFSDGIEKDFLEFNSGTQAVIGIAERKGRLVV